MITLRRSVVLVGLMGAGKTSVGRKLAELLQSPFVDSDDEVSMAANMDIPEIFSSFGEAEFRRLERAVIARILGGEPLVLSTGGGAFMQPEIRKSVSDFGVSVWLAAETSVLWSRVADKPGRPLLESADPLQKLSELASLRNPVYETADVTVRSDERGGQADVAKTILRALIDFDLKSQKSAVLEQNAQT